MFEEILVIGATGALGEPVARRLHADGYPVRVMTRSPDKAFALFGNALEIVAGDVDHTPSLVAAMNGCRAVHINLNGSPDPDFERRGVMRIAQAAAQAGIRRITYISGATVSEENGWFAGTRAKLDAESALRACGVPCAIFKPTFFMESLPRYVRGKRASIIGKQPQAWHWVTAGDYARMVSKAHAMPETMNKDLYVYGPEACTMQEALRRYCAIVHPEVKVSSLPLPIASFLARFGGQNEIAGVLPFFRYSAKAREAGSSQVADALLGAPATTLEQFARNRKAALQGE